MNLTFVDQTELKETLQPLTHELSTMRNQNRSTKDEIDNYRRKSEKKTQKLRQINDKKAQMLERVRVHNKDVYNAYMWVQQNGHRFEKPVLGPLILEVNISNTLVASAFEQLTANWTKYVCFLPFLLPSQHKSCPSNSPSDVWFVLI